MKRLFYILFSIGMILLPSCALKEEMSLPKRAFQSGNAIMAPQTAFESFLYPVLKSRCATCHRSNQPPFFAGNSVLLSYETSKPYINLTQPEHSKFIARTMDSHCDGQKVCMTNGSEMAAAIAAFYENGIKAVDTVETPANTTNEIVIPTLAVNNEVFITMEWDLAVIDTKFEGIKFQVDIQKFDLYSYRLKNPKLVSATPMKVVLKNIHPRLNGFYDDSNNQWASLEKLLNIPGDTFSTVPVITPIVKDNTDTLSFTFESITIVP
jgi:hypothetical protein